MQTREFSLNTAKQAMYNITGEVARAVSQSGVRDGLCVVYCPHTTAGITINENTDPNVQRDLLLGLDSAFPDRPAFTHAEGNSAAHLKSSCVGVSHALIIKDGRLMLGQWQAVYFCEFDGPRSRKYYVAIQ